jgi:hypothetical protein
MNIALQSLTLSTTIARYFVASKKQFLHYGDCEIYLARKPFCGCGLLHQLGYLDYTLASIIYPQYEDEGYLQHNGKRRKKNNKKDAAALELLEKIFGKIESPSFEDLKYDYDDYKKILNNCFTKKEFPSGFSRLDNWLKKKVARG